MFDTDSELDLSLELDDCFFFFFSFFLASFSFRALFAAEEPTCKAKRSAVDASPDLIRASASRRFSSLTFSASSPMAASGEVPAPSVGVSGGFAQGSVIFFGLPLRKRST